MPPAFDALRVPFECLRASRFGCIKAADMRRGAALVLFGVTLGVGVMLALTPLSPRDIAALEAAATGPGAAGEKESAPVGSVKIVDAAPRREIPCAEQTWPYIDRRCLTVAGPKPAKPPAETTAAGSADMTPVTAAVAAPKPPSEAREQTAPSTSEAAMQSAAAEKLNLNPEATPTAVVHQEDKSASAAAPATPVTAAPTTQQPEKRVLKLTDKVGPAVARAVAPVKRAQRTAQSRRIDAKPRIVSRWTEKVYDLGDGRTHRVITVRQGSGPAGYGGARRATSAYAAEDDED